MKTSPLLYFSSVRMVNCREGKSQLSRNPNQRTEPEWRGFQGLGKGCIWFEIQRSCGKERLQRLVVNNVNGVESGVETNKLFDVLNQKQTVDIDCYIGPKKRNWSIQIWSSELMSSNKVGKEGGSSCIWCGRQCNTVCQIWKTNLESICLVLCSKGKPVFDRKSNKSIYLGCP